MPKLGLLDRSWIDIRNYIAKYLLPSLRCMSRTYVPPTSIQCRMAQVDYLTQAIANNDFKGPYGLAISQFFSRWGLDDVARSDIQSFANPEDALFVGRTEWYSPVCGELTASADVVPPRWISFTSAADAIIHEVINRFPGANRSTDSTVKAVLNFILSAESNISSMCYFLDFAVKKMSMTPVYFGMNPSTGALIGSSPGIVFQRDDSNVVVQQVGVFAELSAAVLVDWESAATSLNPYDLWRAGTSMNQALTELAEANVFLADEYFFDRRFYTKPKRFSMLPEYIRNTHPVINQVMQMVGNAPFTKNFVWPTRAQLGESPWLNSIQLARDFERLLSKNSQCGYVSKFYYAPHAVQAQLKSNPSLNKIYRQGDYFILDDSGLTTSFTYTSYDQVLADIQKNALRARLEEANNSSNPVCFNLPLRFTYSELGIGAPDSKQYIEWQKGGFIMKILEGMIQYRWNETYINESSNDLALSMIPKWLVSADAYEYVESSEMITSNSSEFTYLRDGFSLYGDFSWSRTF
jgi:hypothetical protein